MHTELEIAALVTVVLKRLSKACVLCGRQVVWDNGNPTDFYLWVCPHGFGAYRLRMDAQKVTILLV